tara:strand:+ start:4543 stop:5571 length:1029 start_codon:yes stop_codon:yes gene_type:complete
MANEVQNEVTQNNEAAQQSPSAEAFGTEDKGFSFDKVIFGEGDGEGVTRGTPVEAPQGSEIPGVHTEQPEAAPQEGQPAPEEYQAKNDDKRFEYWQSRASKLENQIKETQPLIDHLKENPQILQQAPAQQAPVEEPVEEFPAPPDKPERPFNYSREASFTDPTSESAKYDMQVEEWRDDMTQYNSLKSQYDNAILREEVERQEKARLGQVRAVQAKQQQTQKAQEISEFVQANYDMTPEETTKFMEDMSNPSSISMENLVTLWRMNNGKSGAPPAATPDLQSGAPQQRMGPSDTFQQTQRAQQVPQPMGVMPAQSSNPDDGKTDGEKFMQTLVGNYNDNKIF